MNFLMLFITSLIHCENGGRIDDGILLRVGNDTNFSNINWCEKVVSYLRNSKKNWKRDDYDSHYCGPATFLLLLYLDRTKFEKMTVPRERPVFKNWGALLQTRELLEIECYEFGSMEVLEPVFTDESFFTQGYKIASEKLMDVLKTKQWLLEFFEDEKNKNADSIHFHLLKKRMTEVFSTGSEFYVNEQADANENTQLVPIDGDSNVNLTDEEDNMVLDNFAKKSHTERVMFDLSGIMLKKKPKHLRRRSQRIVKHKLGVNVVTLDGKGLEEHNPVELE